MVTKVAQVRLPKGLLEEIDEFVKSGHYSNRSDVIRDAVRKFLHDARKMHHPAFPEGHAGRAQARTYSEDLRESRRYIG